ncbi:uroporphyrinogen decarboxylase [Actinomyces bovis]|uniref:uroporphyrinogen decarboxylase n=1 Tax=Actinomyces bovis TaxID=1658 RepID=UPI001E38A607|nr:uroporphyrinogen decarboxylase [Actinomyces bovis]
MAAPNSLRPLPALLRALAGDRPERTPVWFMRQAGRSLPEYRALRERAAAPMLDVCLRPELAAEATLQPVRRHGVDAAVFFSDIMVPLRLAGVEVHIEPGVGPVIASPVRDAAAVDRLTAHRYGQGEWAQGVQAVAAGVAAVVRELGTPARPGAAASATSAEFAAATGPAATTPTTASFTTPLGRELSARELAGLRHSADAVGWTPVLGFGGAPFTLAAYLVEGRPSRDHLAARSLMHANPAAWERLMTWCAELTGQFIATQIEAGASAAQLFDSWAGSLCPTDYREQVAPYSALAIARARKAVSPTTGQPAPLIHFGTGTARILADMRDAGAQAVGVDDRTSLAEALEALGRSQAGLCPVQGNLDPALLAAGPEPLERAVVACLEAGRAAPGHVVNLGHGVPPTTDPAVLTAVVAQVHGSVSWREVAAEPWEPGV